MPQDSFDSDFQPYPDFDSDFQPYEDTSASPSFSGWNWLKGSIPNNTFFDSSPTKPDPSTYDYGSDIPGVSPQGGAGNFFQGVIDPFQEMYNYANELGKKGAAQIGEGNWTGAANTVFEPLTGLFKSDIDWGSAAKRALPTAVTGAVEDPVEREKAKQAVGHNIWGLTGLPGESFTKAWEEGDFPRLLGQGTGALVGLHGLTKIGEPRRPVEAAPPPPPGAFHGPEPAPGFFPRKKEWIESQTETPPLDYGAEVYTPRDPRFGQQEFNFEANPDLLAGLPYRAPSGRMTKTGPALPPKMGPEVGMFSSERSVPTEHPWLEFYPEQGDLLKAMEPAPVKPVDAGPMWPNPATRPTVPDPTPTTTLPTASPVSPTPPTVTRGQVLSDVAPKGPRGGMRYNADGSLTVPNQVATEGFVASRADAGFTEVVQNPDGTTTFKKPSGTSAGMFFDPRALELIKEQLRRMFGREPTEVEVQTVAENQARPTEERGGVAPFEPRAAHLGELSEKLRQAIHSGDDNTVEGLMSRGRQLIESDPYSTLRPNEQLNSRDILERKINSAKTNYTELDSLAKRTTNPSEAELFNQLAESQLERLIGLREQLKADDARFGFGQIQKLSDLRERMVPDEVPREGAMTIPSQLQVPPEAPGLDVGGIRQQNLLPDPMRLAIERVDEGPFAATIDPSGNWSVVDSEANRVGVFNTRAEAETAARQMNMTEAVSGIDTPRPAPMGQQELPLGPRRENVPTETPGLAEAEMAPANVDQMFRGIEEPREQQQSMIADMIDNEIDQHFQEQGIESRPGRVPVTPAEHSIDIADRIINQRGGPSTGERTPHGDMRAATTPDDVMGMLHDARDKWHENDAAEGGERTAPSRIQQNQNDLVEIDSNTDLVRARRIRQYWGERYNEVSGGTRPTPERTHAVNMYARAAQRVMEITEGRPAAPPIIPEDSYAPARDLTPEQRVAAATDPNAPLANRRRVAEEEIRASETVEEAVAVRDHWLDQSRDAGHSTEADFAREMARQSRERLNELIAAERAGALTPEQVRQRTRDLDEINAAETTTEANQIADQWSQNIEDAIDTNDYAAETHGRDMRRRARARVTEILDANSVRIRQEREQRLGQVQESRPPDTLSNDVYTPASTAADARELALAEARRAAGPNPPITPGLQPKQPRGIRPTPEQLEKLKLSTNERQVEIERQAIRQRKADRAAGIRTKKEPTTSEKWWRDVWAKGRLAEIPQTGDPGLSIIDTNPRAPAGYAKYYRVEYRDAQGVPVAMAKVTEDSGGVRRVPTMAANADHGAYGVASEAVFKTLLDMNAADAGNGTISNWTAKLVARMLEKMEGTNAGMFDLSQGIKPILKMVQNLLENKDAFNTRTRDGFAKLMDTLNGVANTKWWMDKAAEAGIGQGGQNAPGPSRFRTEGGALSAGGAINKVSDVVGKGVRAVKESAGWGQGEMGKRPADELSTIGEALRVPGGATTMLDMSAPGRQGLATIATPEFWGAAARMFGGLHYNTFKKLDTALRNTDLMRVDVDPVTGKDIPSFGSQIGTKLFSPASEPGPRADNTASRWLEMGIGKKVDGKWQPTLGSKAWQHTAGYPIRAFNRTHLTFLNYLNVHRTTKLLDLARDMSLKGMETGRMPREGLLGGVQLPSDIKVPFSDRRVSTGFAPGSNIGFTKKVTPEQALAVNPYHNIPRAKEIADFVNTATGHGPLKTHILPHRSAEVSLESAADKLGHAFFSPGLIASRIRMMNPSTYVMATPFVRKQYMKAALSTTAAWFIMAQMIKKAAGPEAEVEYNPLSSDFGKVRIGDARLDISGGFAQFAVAASRAWVGGYTSSASNEYRRFGSGYQAETQKDKAENFFTNKFNPAAKFAYDLASASEYKPFHVGDRTMQLFIPLVMQDFHEIGKENPDLFPMFGPAAFFGGGTQIYSKGESVGKFIDPEEDWNVTGGGVRDVMPWNIGVQPGEESNLPRIFPWSESIR